MNIMYIFKAILNKTKATKLMINLFISKINIIHIKNMKNK